MQIQLNRYVSAEKQLTAAGLPEGADALVFCKAIKVVQPCKKSLHEVF